MKAALRVFGELESEVMAIVWNLGPVRVKDVHCTIGAAHHRLYDSDDDHG